MAWRIDFISDYVSEWEYFDHIPLEYYIKETITYTKILENELFCIFEINSEFHVLVLKEFTKN